MACRVRGHLNTFIKIIIKVGLFQWKKLILLSNPTNIKMFLSKKIANMNFKVIGASFKK
jgi:hypothetical protein